MAVFELDTKVACGQNFDHAALKLYVFFSTHRGGQRLLAHPSLVKSRIQSFGLLIHWLGTLSRPTPIGLPSQALRYIEEPETLLCNNAVRLSAQWPGGVSSLARGHRRRPPVRISLEMYIFNDDKIGRRFADALSQAARRGVEVRLLYDSVGCRHASPGFFEGMRNAGVWAIPYHPYRFWRPHFGP
jgi:hypothetical protein